MRGQRAVELVELFAAGGGDGNGDAQVFAALAFTQLYGGGVEGRVELVRHRGDGGDQPVDLVAHDLDGELRGVFDQRFLALRLGAGDSDDFRGVGRCGHYKGSFQACLARWYWAYSLA